MSRPSLKPGQTPYDAALWQYREYERTRNQDALHAARRMLHEARVDEGLCERRIEGLWS